MSLSKLTNNLDPKPTFFFCLSHRSETVRFAWLGASARQVCALRDSYYGDLRLRIRYNYVAATAANVERPGVGQTKDRNIAASHFAAKYWIQAKPRHRPVRSRPEAVARVLGKRPSARSLGQLGATCRAVGGISE